MMVITDSTGSATRPHRLRAAGAMVFAVVLAACSPAGAGQTVKSPGSQPSPTPALNPGNYPTTPRPPPVPSLEGALIAEAQRMGGFVVGPWEIDPELTVRNPTATLVIKDAKALPVVLVDPAAQIAADHQFINAFSTDRSADAPPGHRKALGNLVMRFPTSVAAAVAAAALAAKLPSVPGAHNTRPLPIAGNPQARARQSTLNDGTNTVEAFTPHRDYVLYQYARSQDSLEITKAMVAKTLAAQRLRIDAFTPTDPAQFADMALDPTGLFARTLPSQDRTVNMGVWTASATLHFQGDPISMGQLFERAGVDFVSVGQVTIDQTRNSAAAAELADHVATTLGDGKTPGPTVAGVPGARCFTGSDIVSGNRYHCVAPAERWVITASSKQDFAAAQQVTAQYLMLVGK